MAWMRAVLKRLGGASSLPSPQVRVRNLMWQAEGASAVLIAASSASPDPVAERRWNPKPGWGHGHWH